MEASELKGNSWLWEVYLVGNLGFEIPWLYDAAKRFLKNYQHSDLPEVDCLLITQNLDDHCHLKTLKPLSANNPNLRVIATPNAKTLLDPLFTWIDSIGLVEYVGEIGGTKRLQVDGMTLKFVLWGEQTILAGLLSVRSMLAIDGPLIASSIEGAPETHQEVCLEYGSSTQLYLVPFTQKEEQASISLTPNSNRGSNNSISSTPTQAHRVSQMTLPCNSLGSVDYSNFPFQVTGKIRSRPRYIFQD